MADHNREAETHKENLKVTSEKGWDIFQYVWLQGVHMGGLQEVGADLT